MSTAIEQFKEAKYGLMLHLGLYSMLGGCYRGKRGPRYAEWIQSYFRIPNAETERLASLFQPIYFDADEICAFAKKCGMKYIVITAKHHEGFALFHSKVDSFNLFDASPFRRDLILELSEACKRHGLLFGIYYSQVIDWHEKHGGGYRCDPAGAAGVSWENSWDFPDKSEKNFDLCFYGKIMPQIKELLQNYGKISLAWFDMPLDCEKRHSEEIYALVKSLQKDCLVNSRLGNGVYDYVTLGDNEIPDEIPSRVETSELNGIYGVKPSPYGLYETACTLNGSWGYTTAYTEWKRPETILALRKKLERLGVNYLLNIGLDPLGRIPIDAAEILSEVQRKYAKSR